MNYKNVTTEDATYDSLNIGVQNTDKYTLSGRFDIDWNARI